MPFEYPTRRGVLRCCARVPVGSLNLMAAEATTGLRPTMRLRPRLATAPGWFAGTAFASMCPMTCWTGDPWARTYDRSDKQCGR
jgi:hypothetical protein